MIIIPEIETVVILVPRTGSGSLRRLLADRYPQAMLLYRHMEADGVPQGYDRWRKVGVMRHPIDRLWSMYKFCATAELYGHTEETTDVLRGSVASGFENWLLHNEVVFSTPFDRDSGLTYWPRYSCRHAIPENRKSQFVYLRPDLGTKIYRFDHRERLYEALDLADELHTNGTPPSTPPALSEAASEHIHRFFAWDLAAWENSQ